MPDTLIARILAFLRIARILRRGRYTQSPVALAEALSTEGLPWSQGGLVSALLWLEEEETCLMAALSTTSADPERVAGAPSEGSGA